MSCPSKNYTPKQIEISSQNCEMDKKRYKLMLLDLHPDRNSDCPEDANHKFQEAQAICDEIKNNYRLRKYQEQEKVFAPKEDPRKKLLRERWAREEEARKTKVPLPKKPSPKKPKTPSPKKKKISIPKTFCMALEYSEQQIVEIVKNAKNDPSSYKTLIKNLSPENNKDCPDLATELLQMVYEMYNKFFSSHQFYDGEFDSKVVDYFSNTAETVQVGSTHQGLNYTVLNLNDKPVAIISYTNIEPQIIEIGKAWYRKIDDFEKLFTYLIDTKASTDFVGGRPLDVKPFINASLFSNFQIKFWMSTIGLTQPYFTENALYLTNGVAHTIEAVKFIKDRFMYYLNAPSAKYTVPNHVITYLNNWITSRKLTISSLILTNNMFFTKPPVEEIDSALKYKNSSAVFFQVPINYLGLYIHAIPFPKICKFLFSRLDFHFVGSITQEGVYIYYFPIQIRILLEYLEQSQLLEMFQEQFINAMKKITILNQSGSKNPVETAQEVVKYINENVTLGLVTEVKSELKKYIETIVSLNQPVLKVILLNPNTDVSFDSFLR